MNFLTAVVAGTTFGAIIQNFWITATVTTIPTIAFLGWVMWWGGFPVLLAYCILLWLATLMVSIFARMVWPYETLISSTYKDITLFSIIYLIVFTIATGMYQWFFFFWWSMMVYAIVWLLATFGLYLGLKNTVQKKRVGTTMETIPMNKIWVYLLYITGAIVIEFLMQLWYLKFPMEPFWINLSALGVIAIWYGLLLFMLHLNKKNQES